jgi:nicotinamide-nucleotide amidase
MNAHGVVPAADVFMQIDDGIGIANKRAICGSKMPGTDRHPGFFETLSARPPGRFNMNNTLESVARYMEEKQLKMVTAESCTAGMIASTLADVPGCGKWLDCAFVTYSAESKIRHLDVNPETIERYNLTSEEVAREMAQGALRITRANGAVSTTGLAGPSNGDSDIPVGTVCFAWSFEHQGGVATFSETRRFNGDRNEVRSASTEYAISRIWHYHNELEKRGLQTQAPEDHGSQQGRRDGAVATGPL